MAKFRIKNLAAINYILFAVWVAVAWYHFIPTHHFINTTSEQIDLLKAKFLKNSAIKVSIDLEKTSNNPQSLAIWNNILKTPLEESTHITFLSHFLSEKIENKQTKIPTNILDDLNPK